MVERGNLSPLRFLYGFTWRWCAMITSCIIPLPIPPLNPVLTICTCISPPSHRPQDPSTVLYFSLRPSFRSRFSPSPPGLPRAWKTMTTHPPPIPHLRRPPSKRVHAVPCHLHRVSTPTLSPLLSFLSARSSRAKCDSRPGRAAANAEPNPCLAEYF